MGIPFYLQDWSSWLSPVILADASCCHPLLLAGLLGLIVLVVVETSLLASIVTSWSRRPAAALPKPKQDYLSDPACTQTQEALKQSESFNRAILTALPDLILRLRADGTYLDIKPTTAFPTHFPNLRVGENVRNVLPPPIAQQRLTMIATALQTGAMQVYEYPLTVQGQPLWQEARIMPLNAEEVLVVVRDLTERKRMEEALRQSEARLELAQQVAQVGYWQFDVEQGTRLWSELTFRHLGLDPTQPEPSWNELLQIVHPDDRATLQASDERAIASGIPYALDIRVVHPDGSIHYLEARAEPLLNAQGQVTQLIGTLLDITDRKGTEAALQEREAMLRAIGDNLPKGYIYQIVYEPGKGRYYTYLSAGIERLLGLKPEAVLANPQLMRQVGIAEDLVYADQVVQESLQNLTPIELQMRNRTAEGQIQWSSIRSVPRRLPDGRIVWDGVEVDITELKQIEAALRTSEEQFRRAFDDAPIGVSLVSPTGQFIKMNRRYCELIGYSEAELLELTFADVTHPDDQAADLEGFRQLLAGEIQAFHMEKRYITKQGDIVPVLLNTAMVRDEQGQPLYSIGHVQDIRERRQIERMKDEFISVVSHELRTPLTSIRGALGILESGVFNTRSDKARHMLQIALNNSDRLVRLVNDILTLERLQSGKVALVMESCSVAELMEQAIESVQALADEAGIGLVWQPLVAQVWAAPDLVVQTLTNLLGNAIKFSPSGSTVWLSAEIRSGDWETIGSPRGTGTGHSNLLNDSAPLSVSTATSWVCFAVQDQGRGIPDHKLELIFEPFQQVDVSDSRKKGGTGLGLAICRNIVQQHGGRIWVESTLGSGSTFFLTLPYQPESNNGTA